jgi:hypothetical protein
MKTRYPRAVLAAGALLLAASALHAQDVPETENSDYQRYDLIRDENEFTVESAFSYWQDNSGGNNLHTMSLRARLEYAFAVGNASSANHAITASLPYTLALYSDPEARNGPFYSFGDVSLSYEYLTQFNHVNLFFGPRVSIPLTESNEYLSREGILTAGSGRFTAGFAVTATGIMDPVVWNLGLSYDVGLPKQERFASSWVPGTIQVSASLSDLINERFGFAVGTYQMISLPALTNGVPAKGGVSVSSLARLEVFVLFEKDYIRVSMDTYAYPLNRPVVFGVVYGHQFKRAKTPGS